MAIVCNNIVPQLVVNMTGDCASFTENQSYSAACGSGTATDFCNLNISGGQAPYTTTFSYPQIPTATNATLNMSAFPGGGGATPQFGYGFTSSNMCSLSITGTLRVDYRVTDAAGQVVTGGMTYNVSVRRSVVAAASGGGGGGCVAATSFVSQSHTAAEVMPFELIQGMTDDLEFELMQVHSNRVERQDSVRITMATGATLVVSKSTPLTLKDRSLIMVSDLTAGDYELPVRYDSGQFASAEPFWDTVVDIEDVGMVDVQVINVGGYSYAAGEVPGAYIYTHNATQAKA